MPKIRIDEADALTVADITHAKLRALPATATVVDGDGVLLGVVAVTGDLQSFCGTASDSA